MKLYIVHAAEDTLDYSTSTFVLGVYKFKDEAIGRLAKYLVDIGHEDLKRDTNDQLVSQDRRYDEDGTYACDKTPSADFTFEVQVTEMEVNL
jgi:hypothetical protein